MFFGIFCYFYFTYFGTSAFFLLTDKHCRGNVELEQEKGENSAQC
jgi:hypothetical protein